MGRFETVAQLRGHRGRFLHSHIASLAEWPDETQLPSPHFALFLALDADRLAVDDVGELAERLLEQGLAYLVAWGPDCERVHDIFDECIVWRKVRGIPSPGLVMTSWHADESFADAFEFFALNTDPDSPPWQCTTWLIVTVGERAWSDEIRTLIPHYSEPT